MKPSELAFRGLREASKTMERYTVTSTENGQQPPCLFDHMKPEGSFAESLNLYQRGDMEVASQDLFQRFGGVAEPRFFNGADNNDIVNIIENDHGEELRKILSSADAACWDEFYILGYGRLFFGTPADWHLDPTTGRRAPMMHWSRINPLDDRNGDSKVIWELNRHQWMLDLGQAYRLTGDERYCHVFSLQIRDWMRNNPPGLGINWSSSLEVSIRLISWCWALFLFRGSRALSPTLFVEMLAWMRTHACYIERYLSYYFSPNTHLTGEALGLYYLGTLMPELQGADRWRSLGRQILEKQIHCQVHPDGVYFEQSSRYQYYTVEIYLHFGILAARNGEKLPRQVTERIQKMLDFLLAISRPDGSVPQTGDSDGGWLLPLVRRPQEDFSALFSTAAVFFKRSDYALAAGALASETLWLLGSSAVDVFASLLQESPIVKESRTFREGGYVVIHEPFRKHQLLFDTGPLGCEMSGGHGHADLLSVQCSAFGQTFLVDSGTYCYTSSHKWRDHFRGTRAHNTVTVDGRGQAEPAGPFAWRSRRPSARLNRTEFSPELELADAWHDAYQILDDPVIHRRRVLFVKKSYWLIVDDLTAKARHQVEVRYQFAPIRVNKEADEWVRACRNGRALLIKPYAGIDLKTEVRSGILDPIDGWVSTNYGQRMPAPVLTCRVETELPLRIITLIYPLVEEEAPPPVALPILNNGIVGMIVGQDTVRIDNHNVVLN
ncbi:MAG: alginate lyase family protein [Pseudohongiellaceae bacterium]